MSSSDENKANSGCLTAEEGVAFAVIEDEI